MTHDDAYDGRAPICPYCGVTALAAESWGDANFVCENADCEAFGDSVRAGGQGDHPAERPSVEVGDIVEADDGRTVGLVLDVVDCGSDYPLWELHVDWVVDGAAQGVSTADPSHVRVANSERNRRLLEDLGIRLS